MQLMTEELCPEHTHAHTRARGVIDCGGQRGSLVQGHNYKQGETAWQGRTQGGFVGFGRTPSRICGA